MGKIFFVCGKSCTGKDTLFEHLTENDELNLKTITGYTTRPMRRKEEDGKEYFFVNDAQMNQLISEGRVIERRTYNTVYGEWNYFTVDDGQIDLKNNNYIYIGTLESYMHMADYFGADNVVPIYIEVETGDRLARAVKRERKQPEPKYTEMCRRFIADEEDFKNENIEKAGIVKRYINEDFDVCLSEVEADIRKLIDFRG
ncbi:MAG: guanylate kinase [Eubacterium sp.]